MSTSTGVACIDELQLDGRRVLLRVDFDVPLDSNTRAVVDDEWIRAALPTIRHAMDAGARVILATHLGQPQGQRSERLSLDSVGQRLAELTDWEIFLPDECVGQAARKVIAELRAGQVCLLENLRFCPGEEHCDDAFARALAALCDVYVNEAFSASHLAHASITALPRLKPERACGLLMKQELGTYQALRRGPNRPFVALLGGRDIGAAFRLANALSSRADTLCIGGALGTTLLAATGAGVGKSAVDAGLLAQGRTMLESARDRGLAICLPHDFVVAPDSADRDGRVVRLGEPLAGLEVVDIGPATVAEFSAHVSGAATVIWDGPLGLVDHPAGGRGSIGVARAMAGCAGFTVVAGRQTAAAIRAAGEPVADGIDLLSAGEEPATRLLEGGKLPGVEALRGGQK